MAPVRIKICGVTTVEDAVRVAELGADYVGLNFYPRSPRYVSYEQARMICQAIPPIAIGVAVDPTESDLSGIGSTGVIGVQTYDWVHHDAKRSAFPLLHIPAYRVKDRADLQRIQDELTVLEPFAYLVDSYVPGEMGGTGHRAPWDLLKPPQPANLILAGGLRPDNVADAIRVVQPWGVDVASGVESSPGKKDMSQVRDFIQAVRSFST